MISYLLLTRRKKKQSGLASDRVGLVAQFAENPSSVQGGVKRWNALPLNQTGGAGPGRDPLVGVPSAMLATASPLRRPRTGRTRRGAPRLDRPPELAAADGGGEGEDGHAAVHLARGMSWTEEGGHEPGGAREAPPWPRVCGVAAGGAGTTPRLQSTNSQTTMSRR